MSTMPNHPPRLPDQVVDQFNAGLNAAKEANIAEPIAMTVATREGDKVSARTVLLKEFDANGFVFYTHLNSNKGRQLQKHPVAALTFLWLEIEQQVLVEGMVEQVTDAQADTYFASRPRVSQIGAWASDQSQPLDSRQTFENRIAEYEQKFEGQAVPRPDGWSGFRVRPVMVEFWFGREFRLHDRFRWNLDEGNHWRSQRLYP